MWLKLNPVAIYLDLALVATVDNARLLVGMSGEAMVLLASVGLRAQTQSGL